MREVGKFRGAGADEQLRDVLALQVFGDCGVVGGADRGKIRATSSLLHQPPVCSRSSAGVAIVKRYQVDLAAVDAAALVDHFEIADLALASAPNAETGPLYGMVWPILISVDVTPRISAAEATRPRQHGKRAQRAKSHGKTHHVPPFF